MASVKTQAFLEAVALAAGLAFVVMLLHPAYEFAAEEIFVQTPALEITNAWRAAALPVGFGLMLVVAALRLIECADWRHAVGRSPSPPSSSWRSGSPSRCCAPWATGTC